MRNWLRENFGPIFFGFLIGIFIVIASIAIVKNEQHCAERQNDDTNIMVMPNPDGSSQIWVY